MDGGGINSSTASPSPKDDINDDILLYLQHNIWLPIVLALFLIGIVVGILVYLLCRRRGYKDQYMSLSSFEDDFPKKIKNFDADYATETTRLVINNDDTDTDLLLCQFYLKNTGSYLLVDHMPRLGRKTEKSWFLVRDYKSKHERILTMQPRTREFLLPFTKQTAHALNDLFLQLRHPFLLPCLEVDLIEHDTLVAVEPLSEQGTLFDLIHGTHWSCSHVEKWFRKGQGLSLPQIQTYGRQIIEALIYLNTQGLPPHRHLHSGNVVLRNYSACLSGVHYNFLGLSSKYDAKFADVISFGHLLYEMTTGQVMDTPVPQQHHMSALAFTGRVKQVIRFIFQNESESYPSLRAVRNLEFFQPVALPELQNTTIPMVTFTPEIKVIVKAVKKQKVITSLKPSRKSLNIDPLTARLERTSSQSTISSQGTVKKEVDTKVDQVSSLSLLDEIKIKTKKMAKSRDRTDTNPSSGSSGSGKFPPLVLESQAVSQPKPDVGKVSVPKSMVKVKPPPPPRPQSKSSPGSMEGLVPLATSTPARSALLDDIRKGTKLKKTRKT